MINIKKGKTYFEKNEVIFKILLILSILYPVFDEIRRLLNLQDFSNSGKIVINLSLIFNTDGH